jgi:3-isopropylmalate dehydrogenase
MKTYQIAVIKGDGIGPEVCEATLEVIRRTLSDPRRLHFAEYPPVKR